jgi:hypothetical protein
MRTQRRAAAPLEQPTARRSVVWTGAAGWGRVGPSGVPWDDGLGPGGADVRRLTYSGAAHATAGWTRCGLSTLASVFLLCNESFLHTCRALKKESRADFEPLSELLQMSGSEGTFPLQQLRSHTAMNPKQAG